MVFIQRKKIVVKKRKFLHFFLSHHFLFLQLRKTTFFIDDSYIIGEIWLLPLNNLLVFSAFEVLKCQDQAM